MERTGLFPTPTLLDRALLCALAAGAAAIHFAMVPAHADESLVHGIGFAVAGWIGVAVAVAVVWRPSGRVVAAGTAATTVMIGLWVLSRTVGLPFGPDAWKAESVAFVDLACVGLEVAFVAVALLGIAREHAPAPGWRPAALGSAVFSALLVAGLATAAIASPSARHHHDDATHVHTEAAAAATAAVDATTHVHATTTATPTPGSLDGAHASHHIVTSEDPPTAEQIARADDLIQRTKAALPKRWADFKVAQADGYVMIQNPAFAHYVHFVKLGLIADGDILDPNAPESLVYQTHPGGTMELASAMYILPRKGYPIPDVGGSLTPWHNHGNLCFGANAVIKALVAADGSCPPGSVNVETPDMLHVWIVPHPGGPFGGLEK